MRINNKVIILAINILVCAVVFCPRLCFAAWNTLSLVLYNPDTEAMGYKDGASTYYTSRTRWRIYNDSCGHEDFNIKVYTDTGAWEPSADGNPGNNIYVLKALKYTSGELLLTKSDQVLYSSISDQTNKYFGISFTTPTSGSEEGSHSITIKLTAANWTFVCGDPYRVAHTTGNYAPANIDVTYQTVWTDLQSPGTYKCWIKQNLGAYNPPPAVDNNTSYYAGWYFQFNRAQGYSHDGTTVTPAWTITSINENSDWYYWNDPCKLMLGYSSNWHVPTYSQWLQVDSGWNNEAAAFASPLQLHSAGQLLYGDGSLSGRGTYGYYRSSTQVSNYYGYNLIMYGSVSAMSSSSYKSRAMSVRCILDP